LRVKMAKPKCAGEPGGEETTDPVPMEKRRKGRVEKAARTRQQDKREYKGDRKNPLQYPYEKSAISHGHGDNTNLISKKQKNRRCREKARMFSATSAVHIENFKKQKAVLAKKKVAGNPQSARRGRAREKLAPAHLFKNATIGGGPIAHMIR